MSKPVPTRFSDQELALIDDLVERGIAGSRSAMIRHAVEHLADSIEKERTDAVKRGEVGGSRRRLTAGPVTVDDLRRLALLSADLDDPSVMCSAWS